MWAERLDDRNLLTVAFGLGTAGQEYGKALTVDTSGDVLVATLFQNTLDFDPGAGSAVAGTPPGIDLAVVKYRPDGSMSWVKTVSTLAPNAGALVVPHGVQTDATGNVYVIGYFGFLGTNAAAVSADFDPGPGAVTLTNTGGADPFVAKLDPSGNLLWARTFGNSTASDTEERAWDLAVDASGSVYVAGFLNGTYDLNASPSSSQLYTSAGAKDAFLVKYDAAGNFVWGFGLGTAGDEEGLSVDVDDTGSVFFQGYFNNTLDLDPGPGTTNVASAGSSDLFLARYNAGTGAFQTGVRIGGTLAETSPPGTLRLDASGHVFLSGRFRGTVDLDPGTGTFNVSNLGTGVTDEILLANYTTDFSFRWGFSLPSDGGLDGAHRVDFDTAGNVYIAGWHSGTTDFDPGSGTFNLTSSNAAAGAASDLFLAKYTSAGAFLWADQFGGPVSDQTLSSIVAGMAVDRNGNAYITGQTYGTTDFDPGPGMTNYVPVGLNDAFLAMYDPLGNLADNAAPTATPQTRSTNAGTPLNLTLGGGDGDPEVVQTLTYAIATNPGHGTLSGFNSATGQVTYTPTAGFSGTDSFTFTVTDDIFAGGPSRISSAATVTIDVVATNNPPTITDVPNQTTNEDTVKGPITFTVGDAETSAGSLTVTASSNNQTLIPNANLVLGGSGASRTITLTPAANQSGTATITVTVSDGAATASDTFVLTVTAVNDTPTISDIADQTTLEDTAKGPIAFTVGDAETAAGSLTVTASSDNQTLVPNPNLALGGTGANRTITLTPATNQSGTATITVTVSDGAATTSDTFVLTVTDDDPLGPSIVVSDWLVPAGETAWTIPISVTGGVSVDGINFNIQIDDGSKPVAEAGPVFTALNILGGTIFDGKNTGSWDNHVLDWVAWDWTETTAGETVYADGVIGYITVDTVACPSGTWNLAMSDTLNGPTDFAGLAATIVDGTITVNQRPVAHAGGPYSVVEGGTVTLDGSDSTDPDAADTIVAYEWDLDRDGVFGETGAGAGRGAELGVAPTLFAAGLDGSGTWTVGLRVRDNNSLDSDPIEVDIGITNATPVIALSGASEANEGSVYTLTLGPVTDPDADTVSQWVVHWGDGSTNTYGSSGNKTHVYADDNPTGTPSDLYTITVDMVDEDGTHASAAGMSIAVRNAAPAISINGAPASSPEGAQINLLAEATDPGTADTFTYAWTATKDGSPYATGTGATFAVTPNTPGIYEVSLTVVDDDGGTDTDTCSITVTAAEIVGRHIFYNHSTFDGDDSAANEQDYNAIAPAPAVRGHGHSAGLDESEKELGKQALLPGETATFVNYTSYWLGINGVMLDIANPSNPGGLDASDFEFRVGNDDAPATWQDAPAPAGITVREVDQDADGATDFHRVTLLWEDYYVYNPSLLGAWKYEVNSNGIGNEWLQVTVLATEDTGLPAHDVFYFGSAIGESGNTYGATAQNAFVNSTDAVGVRRHAHSLLNPAPVSDPYDFNRDGQVDSTDAVIVRQNPTNFVTALKLIAAPDMAGGGADALRIASAGSAASAPEVLTKDELAPVVRAAISRIESAVLPASAAVLRDANFEIVDLPGNLVGREIDGRSVQIDADAASYGWFVDATPWDDVEFKVRPGRGEFTTSQAKGPSRDRVDLLTAVMHELGHVLGHTHDDAGVMDETLPLGTRRLWDDDLASLESERSEDLPALIGFADAVDAVFAAAAA